MLEPVEKGRKSGISSDLHKVSDHFIWSKYIVMFIFQGLDFDTAKKVKKLTCSWHLFLNYWWVLRDLHSLEV